MPEAQRQLDARLTTAISHPLRARILLRLADGTEASPTLLADALGEAVSKVSYHVRVLADLECVELVRTQQRRGSIAHFYRATVHTWHVHEQLAGLPAAFRRTTVGQTLRRIVADAAMASREGGFDDLEAPVSRLVAVVDEQGQAQIAQLLAHTRDAVRRIEAESAARRATGDPSAPPAVTTEVALLQFRPAEARCAGRE